jgi:hypothetical protein
MHEHPNGDSLVRLLDSADQREAEETVLVSIFRTFAPMARLNALRRVLGLSRRVLAESAGLSIDRYDRLSNGGARPRLAELHALRCCLGVDLLTVTSRRFETDSPSVRQGQPGGGANPRRVPK